jgi:hypothetical protein
MDQKSCLEAIGRYLVEYAPEPWTEIDVHAEVFDDGLTSVASFYRPKRDPALREPFLIEDAAVDFDFAECFQKLAQATSTPERGLFKECRYHLNSDGTYRADYVY